MSKNIKLAFFMYDMRVGGVETVLVNTINALLDHGVHVTLYSHRTITEPTYIAWLKKHPEIDVYIYYPFARFFDKTDKKHPFTKILKKIGFGIYKRYRDILMAPRVRAQKFDAIIDYISGYSARPLKKIYNTPKITWIHCSFNYFIEHNLAKDFYLYDKIITISDSFLTEFTKKYPEYTQKSVRIYNPVNIADIQKKLQTATVPSGDYFSCISRLDTDKDIPTLLYAFDKFWQNENRPDVKLYIVGDGQQSDVFQNTAKSLPSSKQIVFTGKKSNPFGYMSGAIAHVLSSYNEGAAQVLVESMVVKTLNISSNCPTGPHEILLDGMAGVLFEPGNVDELAGVLGDVYNKKIDTKKLINNATKSLSRFDSKNIAKQIIDLVRGL